jgi:hypothetical protein
MDGPALDVSNLAAGPGHLVGADLVHAGRNNASILKVDSPKSTFVNLQSVFIWPTVDGAAPLRAGGRPAEGVVHDLDSCDPVRGR